MIKKTFIFILSLSLCFLSACSLVDYPQENTQQQSAPQQLAELVFDEDYLVGIFVYIDKYDNENGNLFLPAQYLPTDNFSDNNAMIFYEETLLEGDLKNHSLKCSEMFSDVSRKITNNGAAPNGKYDNYAAFYFTHELIGSSLCVQEVYMTKDFTYYIGGSTSQNMIEGKCGASTIQAMEKSRTNNDGTKEKITYEGKFNLDIIMVDYLIGATYTEFDSTNNIIKTEQIDLAQSGRFNTYILSPDCSYVVFEEEYEVMHSSNYSLKKKGDKYYERTLINKPYFSSTKSVNLRIPLGDGFIKNFHVSFEF